MAKPATRASTAADVGGTVGQQVRIAATGAGSIGGLGQERGDRIGGPGHVVAGVLDDRGARAGRAARLLVGEAHRGRQLYAVAHGEVVEPLVQRLAGVEGRPWARIATRGQHRERRGPLPGGGVGPEVAGARGQVPDDQRPEGVGRPRVGGVRHRGPVLHEGDVVPGSGPGQPRLVDRPVAPQRPTGHRTRRAGDDRAEAQSQDDDRGRQRHPRRQLPPDPHALPPEPSDGIGPSPPTATPRRSCHRRDHLVPLDPSSGRMSWWPQHSAFGERVPIRTARVRPASVAPTRRAG